MQTEHKLFTNCAKDRCFGGGINMSNQGEFMIFCAEQYKYAKQLTGKQLNELFSQYHVWDYLYAGYEALHTTGINYIIHDIDLYIDARKSVTA